MQHVIGWVRRNITADMLTGLGVGVAFAALILAPAGSTTGDAYFWLVICGGILILGATMYRWVLLRRMVEHRRRSNLKGLHQSIKN